MDYNSQDDYRFNNQHPWDIDATEIAFILAENGVRRDANLRPYKCWIPTLMGPKQLPIPRISTGVLTSNIYCNDKECRVPVSNTISTKNYIDVHAGDHTWFTHRWFDHGATVWFKHINGDVHELKMESRVDPSYCLDCLTEHPGCNTVHGCIRGE